jgi:hypothetical protein
MPRRGRPSTDITSKTATPQYRAGHASTFGKDQGDAPRSYRHTHIVYKVDPKTGEIKTIRSEDA